MYPWILETPFGFSVDLSFWQEIFLLPPNELIKILIALGGWTILALIFFYMGAELWLEYRRKFKYVSQWKWVLLAVDIPPLFVQTPKAVEQIFVHLSGAQVGPNIGQKYWQGKKQKWFSFEIVSIEGYIQFLIYTEAEFRDLVEAAVYAQYPEAEITEVEDYAGNIPGIYPNSEYDMFGVEFKLAEPDAYPIRLYPSFEYNISKDQVFSDPMAAILENFSRIGTGENFWMQIIVEPITNKWKERGIEVVKKIISGKKAANAGVLGSIMSVPQMILQEFFNVWNWSFEPSAPKEEAPPGKVQDLTPGNKALVESIEQKISKIGFKSKLRILYAARKEVYNPSRCIDGFIGAMNQFHILNSNALVPHAVTLAHYAFKGYLQDLKKTIFTQAFKKRKIKTGTNPYILNIEELATIWHFPLPFVKTPLLQKAGAKRAEPPMSLPVETLESPFKKKSGMPYSAPEVVVPPPPEELPYG